MSFKILRALMTTLLVITAAACGKNSMDNQSQSLALDENLLGKWLGKCESTLDEGDGSYTSERIDLEFTATAARVFLRAYSDKDCVITNAHYTKAVFSTWDTADTGKELRNIDYVVTNLFFRPQTDNEAAALNREKKCHYEQWTKDKAVDITDFDCGKDKPINKGDKGFDVYLLKDDTAQFGFSAFQDPDSDVGRTEATRPTAVDSNVTYSKSIKKK